MEDDEVVSALHALSGKGAVTVTVEVAGKDIEMELDTGATSTVVPTSLYEKHLKHVRLEPSSAKLQSYCGQPLRVRGEAMVPIKYQDQQMRERLLVVDVGNKPAILGRNWLTQLRLDWSALFSVGERVPVDPVKEFPQLFEPGIGTLQGYQARITLSSDATPKFHRPRPVPYALQKRVDDELDRLQAEGIIRPVESSEWAAPIVVVRKSNSDIRVCGDYKVTINKYLEVPQYPMLNPQDLFATLAGGKRFSRLDMKQAYQQMPMERESQQYLTVNTSKGLFAYTRMPFGISTAPGLW